MTDKPYAMVPIGPNGKLERVEFEQEIEVSWGSFWNRKIFVGYDPGCDYPWKVRDELSGGVEGWKCARLPQPKRPNLKPGDIVGIAGNSRGIFVGWNDDGGPMVAPASEYSRIKLEDGTWYPPQDKE